MSKYSALYTDFPWADASVEQSILTEANCRVIASPDNREETLAGLSPGVDAIITCWAPVTAKVIDAAVRCRHIARTGIGLDNIDVRRAGELGIVVTNVPDYCSTEVAEHALAMIFALSRKIVAYDRAAKQGVYDLVGGLPVERLAGRTLGILGTGQIGAALAGMGVSLGMRVLVHNRSRTAPPGTRWLALDELFAESDFLSVNVPLSPETHHIVNRRTLALMKPTACLVNTSRGGLVDHVALAEALAANRLGGAGLDVHEPEPPPLAQPPWNDPRVIVTPHVAFYSSAATNELRTRVARQVADMLLGRRPEKVVNPDVWERRRREP